MPGWISLDRLILAGDVVLAVGLVVVVLLWRWDRQAWQALVDEHQAERETEQSGLRDELRGYVLEVVASRIDPGPPPAEWAVSQPWPPTGGPGFAAAELLDGGLYDGQPDECVDEAYAAGWVDDRPPFLAPLPDAVQPELALAPPFLNKAGASGKEGPLVGAGGPSPEPTPSVSRMLEESSLPIFVEALAARSGEQPVVRKSGVGWPPWRS